MNKTKITYDEFVRRGLLYGFLDDQIDFLWEIFAEREPDYDNSYPKNLPNT